MEKKNVKIGDKIENLVVILNVIESSGIKFSIENMPTGGAVIIFEQPAPFTYIVLGKKEYEAYLNLTNPK